MSTCALFGVMQPDGTIKFRKKRGDGYIKGGLGQDLFQNFVDHNRVTPDIEDKSFVFHNSTSDVRTCKTLDDFLRADAHIFYHYLFKDNKWYVGRYSYDDGWLIDPCTGEKTRKVWEASFKENDPFTPLEDRFKVTQKMIFQLEYIPTEEEKKWL